MSAPGSVQQYLTALVAKVGGGEILAPSKTHIHRFEIYGSKGNKYVVAFRNGPNVKRWECGCMGWIRTKMPCKHLKAMAPALHLIAPDANLKPYIGDAVASTKRLGGAK